jgi:hypothetical protein
MPQTAEEIREQLRKVTDPVERARLEAQLASGNSPVARADGVTVPGPNPTFTMTSQAPTLPAPTEAPLDPAAQRHQEIIEGLTRNNKSLGETLDEQEREGTLAGETVRQRRRNQHEAERMKDRVQVDGNTTRAMTKDEISARDAGVSVDDYKDQRSADFSASVKQEREADRVAALERFDNLKTLQGDQKTALADSARERRERGDDITFALREAGGKTVETPYGTVASRIVQPGEETRVAMVRGEDGVERPMSEVTAALTAENDRAAAPGIARAYEKADLNKNKFIGGTNDPTPPEARGIAAQAAGQDALANPFIMPNADVRAAATARRDQMNEVVAGLGGTPVASGQVASTPMTEEEKAQRTAANQEALGSRMAAAEGRKRKNNQVTDLLNNSRFGYQTATV